MAGSAITVRRIASLAWPMLIGQLAVIGNGIIDTMMAGRVSAVTLAAVGIGSSIYAVVYVCLLGALQAIAPIVAGHFGGQRLRDVGHTWRQGLWLSAGLLIPGSLLMLLPDPILELAGVAPSVAEGASQYLQVLALGLPAALWFRLFTILNTALSRPRIVMAISLIGPLLKVPLNALFMFGTDPTPWLGGMSLPPLGAAGCGAASVVIYWISMVIGMLWLRGSASYSPFELQGIGRPDPQTLGVLLKLGLPIGITYLIDVTAFSLMTLLIGRLGTAIVSGHAIASNLAVAVYMIPVAIGNATCVLAAQALGGNQPSVARQVARHGLLLATATAITCATLIWFTRAQLAATYSTDSAVVGIATPLLALVAVYHIFDAIQCTMAFVLRAWRITMAPLVIFAMSLWGVGIVGGWALAFEANQGAAGFWLAATAALAIAGLALGTILLRTLRSKTSDA